MKPSCVCSFATNGCLYDMRLFLLSLSYSNPSVTVILFVDDDVQTMIHSLENLDLKLTMFSNLNEYSNKNRVQMEKEGTWINFQMTKSKIMDYCLSIYPDVLFLDSDVFVINEIIIPDSCDLALSPHYIRKLSTDSVGYYNGGCIWTNNKQMPEKWRFYTETSRFFDQASLEDCSRLFDTKEFGENYNISWWRLNQSDEDSSQILSYFSFNNDNVYYKDNPIIFVHTHFNNNSTEYNEFNILIRIIIELCNAKKTLINFFTDNKYNMDLFHEFRKDSGIIYPPFSTIYFEKYFYKYIMSSNNQKMIDKYIPVYWTENQISTCDSDKCQKLIDSLQKDTTYFTIVQHDDGITMVKMHNTIVFGMGGVGNIPLPLTYENSELFETYKNTPKTIFCSFIGSITHPCRKELCYAIIDKPNVFIKVQNWTNTVSETAQKLFIDITSNSRFTLSPRGYGKTSFRMYEALKLGSIPVYVYDDPWLPYTEILDWNKLAVLIHINDIPTMYERLCKITDNDIYTMLAYYDKYKHLFTFDGMCEYIVKKMDS